LPHGGPPSPPPPPPDTKCPKDTHYWSKDHGCCAPRQPPPRNPKPPTCPTDWEWKDKEHKCRPCATPPSPPKHKPSPKPDYHKKKDDKKKDNDKKDNDHDKGPGYQKRSTKNRVIRCPSGLVSCPVSGLTGGYECLDTATELESCGGCVTLGQGQDCNKIEGAWNVACERGTCKGTPFFVLYNVGAKHMRLTVYSCEGGYRLDADKNTCVSL
jgi:hypothetical protein